MADIVVTSTTVLGQKPFTQITAKAGEAMNAGMSSYLNGDGLWYKALANGNAMQAGNSDCGIVLNNVIAMNQPVVILASGKWNSGCSGLTNGTAYCVSATAGGICPQADLGSGKFVTILGIAMAGNQINMPGSAGPFVSSTTI